MSDPDVLADDEYRAPVLESRTVFDGAVWNVQRDRFSFGGAELVREYLVHPGAVAILAEDDHGRVLLIKQYRHPIGCRDWELPAGLRDMDGEAPVDTARRELAEEADVDAAEWNLLTEFSPSPGGSSEMLSVYHARGLTPRVTAFNRTAEEAEIEVRWVPLEDAVAAVLDGRLHNGILALAVLNAHARR
ncbi:MAG: NUDIX hydrolase [Terrimesophilobacter sp.]